MRRIGDMRGWLDQNGGTPVHFSVEREAAVGIVTIQFDTDDDLVDTFRGSYID
jgi:hypothetical protein